MIKVYDHPLSPYAQKVKIALLEKGLEFEALLPENIGSGAASDEFREANPRAEVPALVHDGFSIFDSTIILEYIEDQWPEPRLLPATPAQRARARMIEEVMDTHYEPINWGLAEVHNFGRASGDLADRIIVQAGQQLASWQSWLTTQLDDSTWFCGNHFGWADLAVIPYLNGSAGFGYQPTGKLNEWMERANARESVRQVAKAATEIMMGGSAAGMAAVRAALEQGLFKREYRDHRLEWMIKTGGIDVVIQGLTDDNIRFTPEFPSGSTWS
jgi:glutathione S-transferase